MWLGFYSYDRRAVYLFQSRTTSILICNFHFSKLHNVETLVRFINFWALHPVLKEIICSIEA
jgi:hypothetical protein